MGDDAFWPRLVVATLAVWRIAHLLAKEDGPADLIVRIRVRLGDRLGELLDCFYCLSVWVAAPLSLFVCRDPLERLVTWIALSGGACLLERMTDDELTRKAVGDELLRSEARDVTGYELTAEHSAADQGAAARGWN